ncbi:potassium transporter 5-like [Typha angustifolia]|uniref:potassium transporter 5-like n=1 Tax=Typha angustifolia TaxID=59011 RepID=UPI003C2EBAF0
MELSGYKLKLPDKHLKRAERVKEAMERNKWSQTALLSLVLLGTCMVIGDGILTPCISGLFQLFLSYCDLCCVVAILVVLFSIQRFGTDKVGYTFAPAILVWYLFIGIVSVSNLIRHDSTVAFTGLAYPCLICAYLGQAAYLSKYPNDVSDAFLNQLMAMVSAAFAIVKQSMALGCFPGVRVIQHEGQSSTPPSCSICRRCSTSWAKEGYLPHSYAFEVERKVASAYLSSLGANLGISRVPGVGLLYTELTHGIPSILPYFLINLPAIHSVLELFSVNISNPSSSEAEEEVVRFLESSRSAGVVYLPAHSEVKGSEDSSLLKRMHGRGLRIRFLEEQLPAGIRRPADTKQESAASWHELLYMITIMVALYGCNLSE